MTDSNEILSRIERLEKRVENLEIKLQQNEPVAISEKPYGDRIQQLAANAGLTVDQLKHVFHVTEEDVYLIAAVDGINEVEKQIKATVAILTTQNYLLGVDEIKSKKLRPKLEKLGIRSLINLSTNLAQRPDLIVPKGEPKSPDFSYQITYPGLRKGLEIIKELATKATSSNNKS